MSWPADLGALRRFAERPGRHRMARLIEPLRSGGWWRQLDAIKVAGSNGKGSVATMVATILRAAGVGVGLTVSPHVVDFGERMQVDGELPTPERLAAALSWLRPRLASPLALADDPPLAFEAVTAMALRVFEQQAVETVVAEAGIGGRHDATGVLPGSLSAIVSIDLEHTAILGSTREAIASDKARIAAPGSTLLLGPVDDSVVRRLRAEGEERQVEIVPFEAIDPVPDAVHWGVSGAHQRDNGRLAAALARRWLGRHRPSLERASVDRAIRRGLSTVVLPARFEKVRDQPPVWLDGAHTPAAVAGLIDSVQQTIERPLLLVAGVSPDKDPRLLIPLIELARQVVVTRPTADASSLDPVARLARAADRPTRVVEPVPQAIEVALDEARRQGFAILVAGSVLLAGAARSVLLTAR